MILPLPSNSALPALPVGGVSSIEQIRTLPNARILNRSMVFPSTTPSVFAFQKRRVHRNLYRVTIDP